MYWNTFKTALFLCFDRENSQTLLLMERKTKKVAWRWQSPGAMNFCRHFFFSSLYHLQLKAGSFFVDLNDFLFFIFKMVSNCHPLHQSIEYDENLYYIAILFWFFQKKKIYIIIRTVFFFFFVFKKLPNANAQNFDQTIQTTKSACDNNHIFIITATAFWAILN